MRISDWSSDVCSSDLYSRSQGLTINALQVFVTPPCVLGGIDELCDSDCSTCRSGRAIGASRAIVRRTGYQPRFRCIGTDAAAFRRRSEEHTSELQSLMRISYAVFCLKKKQKLLLINKL